MTTQNRQFSLVHLIMEMQEIWRLTLQSRLQSQPEQAPKIRPGSQVFVFLPAFLTPAAIYRSVREEIGRDQPFQVITPPIGIGLLDLNRRPLLETCARLEEYIAKLVKQGVTVIGGGGPSLGGILAMIMLQRFSEIPIGFPVASPIRETHSPLVNLLAKIFLRVDRVHPSPELTQLVLGLRHVGHRIVGISSPYDAIASSSICRIPKAKNIRLDRETCLKWNGTRPPKGHLATISHSVTLGIIRHYLRESLEQSGGKRVLAA